MGRIKILQVSDTWENIETKYCHGIIDFDDDILNYSFPIFFLVIFVFLFEIILEDPGM